MLSSFDWKAGNKVFWLNNCTIHLIGTNFQSPLTMAFFFKKGSFMKIFLSVLFLLFSFSAKATVSCQEADGLEFTGRDGVSHYCIGPQNMNWWSAYAWCDSVSGKLFDMADCQLASNTSPYCPQLFRASPVLLNAVELWTKHSGQDGKAIRFLMASNVVFRINVVGKSEKIGFPLCKIQ